MMPLLMIRASALGTILSFQLEFSLASIRFTTLLGGFSGTQMHWMTDPLTMSALLNVILATLATASCYALSWITSGCVLNIIELILLLSCSSDIRVGLKVLADRCLQLFHRPRTACWLVRSV